MEPDVGVDFDPVRDRMGFGQDCGQEGSGALQDLEEDCLEEGRVKLHLADLIDHDEIGLVEGTNNGLDPDDFKGFEVYPVASDPRRPRASHMGQDPLPPG